MGALELIKQSLFLTLTIVFGIVLLQSIINVVVGAVTTVLQRLFGTKVAMFIMNRCMFLGVIHHELSHILFAILTGARVVDFSLFHPKGDKLGYVNYQLRGDAYIQSIQCCLTSTAPLIMSLFTCFTLYYVVLDYCTKGWQRGIVIYAIVSILLNSRMSKQDIQSCKGRIVVCVCTATIAIFIITLVVYSVR